MILIVARQFSLHSFMLVTNPVTSLRSGLLPTICHKPLHIPLIPCEILKKWEYRRFRPVIITIRNANARSCNKVKLITNRIKLAAVSLANTTSFN